MGSAGIESVTASLDAARRVGDQIGEAVAAQDEVERLLREVAPPRRAIGRAVGRRDADDADDAHSTESAFLKLTRG